MKKTFLSIVFFAFLVFPSDTKAETAPTSLDNWTRGQDMQVGERVYYDGCDLDKMFSYVYLNNPWFFISRLSDATKDYSKNPLFIKLKNGEISEEEYKKAIMPKPGSIIQFVVFPLQKNIDKYYAPMKRAILLPKTKYIVKNKKKFGNSPYFVVELEEIE